MRKGLIEYVRAQYRIPNERTDEDLERILANLNGLRRFSEEFRVACFIQLEEFREKYWPKRPMPFSTRSAEDFYWLWRCELFFVEGHFGPCCIWARATVEYELQEMYFSDPKLTDSFEVERVENGGRNPGIQWLMCHLDDCHRLTREQEKCCKRIADNGDFVIHHRLDGMNCDQSVQDMLIKFNLTEKMVSVPGFDSKRVQLKAARPEREEIMAGESMKSLYEFESRRSGP